MIERDSKAAARPIARPSPFRTHNVAKALPGLIAAMVAPPAMADSATAAVPWVEAAPASAPVAAEAWWTGPIVASSGGTLPQGHVLFEPYLFDARSAGSDYVGSLTYLLYGATNRLTVGLIPTAGSARSVGSGHGRRVAISDLTLNAQYRIHQAAPGDLIPTWSLVVKEVLPLGRFDRLHDDPDKGIGSGAYATIVGIYAQRSDILASGRTLRTRLNLTYSLSARTDVRDASIFGTPDGFDGKARPGRSAFADVSVEYSLSRNWVLACDGFYRHTASTSVSGVLPSGETFTTRSRAQHSFAAAPAIEYSWSAARGVLLGIRRVFPGQQTHASWTPVFAFNAYL
jgi:hypothetical protein